MWIAKPLAAGDLVRLVACGGGGNGGGNSRVLPSFRAHVLAPTPSKRHPLKTDRSATRFNVS